jgi:dienelactone hydrolase
MDDGRAYVAEPAGPPAGGVVVAHDWEPPDTPERFAVELRAAGTEVEVHAWPETGHSFANPDVPAHAPAQAAEAWAVTVAFLRRHLDAGS